MIWFGWLWFLVHVVGRAPRPVLYALANIGGVVLWLGSSRIRRTINDHMRHVLGVRSSARERTRAARGCARAAARYYADFCRGPHLSPSAAFDDIESIEGMEHWFEAYDRGCGLIVCSAHLGNPENFARATAQLGFPLLVLTEPLSPPRVNAFVHKVRSTPGARFAPVSLTAVRNAITHLRSGGVLAIMGDRDILHKGHPTTFFGERARLPTGAVDLALRTGAPILPAFAIRTEEGRFRVYIDPAFVLKRTGDREADLDAGMRAMAAALEAGIRRAPDQWFPLQPVWSGLAL